MKSSKLTLLITGLIAIIATVIAYFLIFDDIFAVKMRWISLIFLLIAEIIGIAKALLLRKDIITQASILTSVIHFIAVLLISILFIGIFSSAVKAYILLNILALCALAAIDLFILYFGKSISENNRKLAQSQGVIDACYAKVQSLAVIYGQGNYKNDLIEIADLFKYSDNSELTNDEAAIISKLDELEARLKEESESVPELISEIKNAINLRTIKIKSIKRGGY